MNPNPMLYGYQLIENPSLMVPKAITRMRTVRRTWKERLLSMPWRPWAATELRETTETELVPDPNIYRIDGKLICHPSVAQKINDAIDEKLRSQ